MMQLSSKNDDSSLCYDVIITHTFLKIDKFGDFSCDFNYNRRTDVFRDVIYLIINHCEPRRLWRTQCQPAAQRKQAMRAYIYIYIYIYTA